MFVSESKFRDHPADFIPHILNPNPPALEALITKPAVEAALLVRLAKKAKWYGQELGPTGEIVDGDNAVLKINVAEVVTLYRDYIIPLTKEVEVSLTFSSRVCEVTDRSTVPIGRVSAASFGWTFGRGNQDFDGIWSEKVILQRRIYPFILSCCHRERASERDSLRQQQQRYFLAENDIA